MSEDSPHFLKTRIKEEDFGKIERKKQRNIYCRVGRVYENFRNAFLSDNCRNSIKTANLMRT